LPVRKFFTKTPQSKPLVKLQAQPAVPLQSESTLLSHVSLDRSDISGQASFDSLDTDNNVGIIDIIDNNVAKNDPRETPDSMYLSNSSKSMMKNMETKYVNNHRLAPLSTSNTPCKIL